MRRMNIDQGIGVLLWMTVPRDDPDKPRNLAKSVTVT